MDKKQEPFGPALDMGMTMAKKAELEEEIERLNQRVQDLLEANNRELERRRKAEQTAEYHVKFNGLMNGPLFEAYIKLEAELKKVREEKNG